MKKQTKYLDFYKQYMKLGRFPRRTTDDLTGGLCGVFGADAMDIFKPTPSDCEEYGVYGWSYWASESDAKYHITGFGPTRQNIVLFLAAMNNEL